jgi:hypothetical protein
MMSMSRAPRLFSFALSTLPLVAPLALAACSSAPQDDASFQDDGLTSARRRPKPPVDAGTDAQDSGTDATDAAPPTPAYPAFTPDVARLVSRGGRVLTTPRLQVVTFAGDPLARDIEAFASRLGASSYWQQATSEYGVGPMQALPPIRLSEAPPAAVDDADFRTWLASKLAGSRPAFGAPDAQTIYAVFYPAGTKVTIGTQLTGCVNSGGYHWDTTVGSGSTATDVAYVVMPRCSLLGNLTGTDVLTSVASHELAEAVTDPLSQTSPAYFAIDDAHFAFGDYYEPEIGDLCVQDRYLVAKPADIGYTVQRLWSNASAAAGHHPCVPQQSTYFVAQPVLVDSATVAGYYGTATTRVVTVPLNRSKTIDLQLFSDAPMAAWSVVPYDVATVRGSGGAELTFSLDRSTGTNGDVLHLTITRTKAAARGFSEAMIWSRSADGTESNFVPFIVD